MSSTRVKIARVAGGVVEILQGGEFYPADDVQILGAGEADSNGIVIINGLVARYMTNTQLDTAYILNQLIGVIDNLVGVTSHSTYLIGANTPVFGPIPEFAQLTTSLEAIKQSIEGHKIT